MEAEQSTLELVLNLISLGITAALGLGVLVGGLVKLKHIRPMLKAGLVLGLVILALKIPGIVATAIYIDVTSLVGPELQDVVENQSGVIQAAMWVGLGIGFLGSVAAAVHTALAVGLGQMAQSNAYPLLSGAKQRTQGWALAAAFGTISGVVTVVLFSAMDIKEGESLNALVQKLMPGLNEMPLGQQLALAMPTVLAYAIAEEVTYRGILQGWITRLLGDNRGAVITAVLITSVAWAIAHASNTDAIGVKLTQIFLLGLVFGWLARRYSVESAIIAHVSLNASVVVATYFTQ